MAFPTKDQLDFGDLWDHPRLEEHATPYLNLTGHEIITHGREFLEFCAIDHRD
jgi:hypothetical protein